MQEGDADGDGRRFLQRDLGDCAFIGVLPVQGAAPMKTGCQCLCDRACK